MATVVLQAALPSVRLGLAAMLTEHGHTIVSDEAAPDDAVWVLDGPGSAALDALAARRYADMPRAAVILGDDSALAPLLAQAGLRGWAYLARDAGADDLDLAVRSADTGLVLLDLPTATGLSQAAAALSAPAGARSGLAPEPLTPRELQVLQLVAQGLPNKGIARALSISENTAKFHVSAVCAKLGASSRAEAVALGARRGLILL